MATNVRRFASGDFIEVDDGALTMTGAYSCLALVLARSNATFQGILTGINGASGIWELGRDSSNKVLAAASTPGTFRTATGVAYVIADGWALVAVTKAAGTTTPRFHVNKSAGFTHADSDTGTLPNASAMTAIRIGFFAANDPLIADLAFAAVWNGTVLSDAQLDGLTSMNSVYALAPSSLWRLDQASVGTSVIDAFGSANQQAISGTTVVTDTPWFNPDLMPPTVPPPITRPMARGRW